MCGHPCLHLQISSLLFFLSFYSFCLSVFFYLLIHLLLASWGLGCREWVFSSHGEQGLLSTFGAWASCSGGFSLLLPGADSGVRAQQLWLRASLPRNTWDLSFPARDQTHVPCLGR